MATRSILVRALFPLAAALSPLAAPAAAAPSASVPVQEGSADEERELEELLGAERREADRARRLGDLRAARRILDRHLDEEPADAESRTLRALCRFDAGEHTEAVADARRALDDALAAGAGPGGTPEIARTSARNLAGLHLALGEAREALAVLGEVEDLLQPGTDARDAWALGRALWMAGERERARAVLREGAEGERGPGWRRLFARARCERRLGFLERASRSLVQAARSAQGDEGREPEVLVELGDVYFEADGEVEHRKTAGRSPAVLYHEALEVAANHEGALLGLFRLHRVNWNRQSRPAWGILEELLLHHPRSIEGLLAGASADIDDGQLPSARRRLSSLREICPNRREVRSLEAALSWVEHRRDETRAVLAELAREDPLDASPERGLGRHLNELYRFGEAVEFLRAAVERDPDDHLAWTELGRSLANTGDERAALEALRTAIDRAQGRQNAWRHNTARVLERMRTALVTEKAPADLSFAWSPEAAAVLGTYLVPFYTDARAELAHRYGFTPGPVHIEVFDRHQDFSVRSTGFEGFPALGVCFGPVVTAVSPLCELRGRFSWARTSFHEFTHVIHLGLSHNRCPRWITEGLATWEEETKNPAWTRNMRRELADALANGDLIGVRDLNRAFRGPRILFGYYQGGLLCRMLIEEHGFPPMIRLLEAFDRGLDLDQAFGEVFGLAPEEVDRRFEAFVRSEVAGLAIEPRWAPGTALRAKLALAREPPAQGEGRQAWADRWCTAAWAFWQEGKRVDAEEALRVLQGASLEPPRALFLRGEMALARGAAEDARSLFERAFAAGGEEYRARMAVGRMAMEEEDWKEAERHFLAAERAFPGFEDPTFSAELHLAQVYGHQDREEDLQRARERWLAYNADEYELRERLGRWHAGAGRFEEASRWYREANEIDPFRRDLHVEWGRTLSELGRHEEALREFRVAGLVPPALDPVSPDPPDAEEQARMLGLQAIELAELGRAEEAAALARKALELDGDCEEAKRALERVP